MRRMAALLLTGVLCVCLCACGGKAPPVTQAPEQESAAAPVEVKRFSLAYDPEESLHPITGTSQVNRMLTSLVYEGLFALDDTFEAQPVLAQSAERDDSGMVWTITIKEGVRFSDGTPLEASHVTASLNTARKSELYAGRLKDIASVRTTEQTVVITLSVPNGALPALLDIPVVLERAEGAAPLGTGRYRYAQDGERLYLMANYNRGADLPYDTIGLYPVTGGDERLAAFDSGAVNAVLTDHSSPYALGYSGSYEAWDYGTTDLIYVGFKAADGPCRDPLVRRAFALAFDRDGVVSGPLSGHGDATALPIPSTHREWSQEAAAELSYDPQGAAALLEQAGCRKNEEDGLLYTGRAPLAVTLLVNSDNSAKTAIADLLAAELAGLGVTVSVTKLPWKDYLIALEKGNFDLYLGEVRLTGDFDVTELLTGGLNYGRYDPAPLTELISARKAYSGQVRLWAGEELWSAFAEEVPVAPLCFKRDSLLVHWGLASGLSPIWSDPFHNMENWK